MLNVMMILSLNRGVTRHERVGTRWSGRMVVEMVGIELVDRVEQRAVEQILVGWMQAGFCRVGESGVQGRQGGQSRAGGSSRWGERRIGEVLGQSDMQRIQGLMRWTMT